MNFAPHNAPTEDAADGNLRYVWLISIVAALGGLLFGWDWVVIGGAKPFFERFFHIADNAALSGWANSCALIGCLFGALSDRFGRKRLLALPACRHWPNILLGALAVGI